MRICRLWLNAGLHHRLDAPGAVAVAVPVAVAAAPVAMEVAHDMVHKS